MYLNKKSYVGFCTPRRTVIDLKKKKKVQRRVSSRNVKVKKYGPGVAQNCHEGGGLEGWVNAPIKGGVFARGATGGRAFAQECLVYRVMSATERVCVGFRGGRSIWMRLEEWEYRWRALVAILARFR
jgi:hypothetical protein